MGNWGRLCVLMPMVLLGSVSAQAQTIQSRPTPAANRIPIAAKGLAVVQVVESDSPTASEKKACEELVTWLKQITGAEFKVFKESQFTPGQPAIYLGQTKYAAGLGIDFAKLGDEEMVLRADGKNLVISGGRQRGTLYAVYELLEREAGCHWLAWDTSVIPKNPYLGVRGDLKVDRSPAFPARKIYVGPSLWGDAEAWKKNNAFLLRNRGQDEWNPEIGGAFVYSEGHPHTFYMFMDPKEYFAEHPEYYSMNEKGVRTAGTQQAGTSGSQLCLSNPDLPAVMAKNVLKYIKQRDEEFTKRGLKVAPIVDISAEDNGYYICKCPACVKISMEEGSEGGLLVRFLNSVAVEIAKDRPDVKVRSLAYVSTDKAPLRTKPADNVIIFWADLYTRSDCFRPLAHPVNKQQFELLQGWAATHCQIHIWDYWNMGGANSRPAVPDFVSPDTIMSDMRLYKKSGVTGIFAEAEMGVTSQSFYDLSIWVGMQLMDNPELDAQALIDTFMDGYYGPAAKPIREYYKLLAKALADEKESMDTSHSEFSRSYLTMDFLTKCRELLLKAEAASVEGSTERAHVDREMVVVYNCILNQWDRMKAQYGKEFPFPKGETLDKYARIREVVILSWKRGEKRQSELISDLKNEMDGLRVSAPLPEQFKGIPADKLVDFPWPKLTPWSVLNDPDATGGKAVGFKVIPQPGRDELDSLAFGLYDRPSKISGPILKITSIPQDEKYHIYKMGHFALGKDTIIWGHGSWGMTCAYLAPAYINADGMKENPNECDVYISLKITGPLYVSGSTKGNTLWCDRVILVRTAK